MTQTARNSNARGLAIDAAEEFIATRIAANPAIAGHDSSVQFVRSQARTLIEEVVDEPWFYGSLTAVYGDIVAVIVADTVDVRPIALGEKKNQLKVGLLAIAAQLKARCADLSTTPGCADQSDMERLEEQYSEAVEAAVDKLPDEFELDRALVDAGSDWMKHGSKAQTDARWFEATARLVRLVSMLILAICLGLIIVLNRAPLSRLMASLGWVLVLSSALFLAASYSAERLLGPWLEQLWRELSQSGLRFDDSSSTGSIARDGLRALFGNLLRQAVHASDVIAGTVLGGGLGALLSALLLRGYERRRQRALGDDEYDF
ncbi:MAG: hypothetical protein AAGC55_18460 [Myxococcota bacterium]